MTTQYPRKPTRRSFDIANCDIKTYGVDAIAAFQLVLPLIMMGAMLSQVFSTGIQTVCSRCMGSGRIDDAKSFYTVTVLTIIPIALLWLLGIWLFAEPLVAILGATGETAYWPGEPPTTCMVPRPPLP